ncbi:MAG: CDP-diacylglycerol--glycerol-3-phosphate 3-phosphatidyltransferase [Clostridia bacterium]|nr:CDP-diacylglycerol--glycerol-3-phosphate 3-phosphatidyltransferase [Clostridia bacterium]
MNLPNRLTLLRILLIPVILLFLIPLPDWPSCQPWNEFIATTGRLIAFLLFAIASITDLVDGQIARKRNLVTTLGQFLDPIADKMLVVSVLIALVQLGRVHALVTIIVIIREFVITGIRLIAAEQGLVIAAGNLGKAKTVSQILAILLILIEDHLALLTSPYLDGALIKGAADVLLYISVILTLWSGIDYLLSNRSLLKS